MSGPWEKYQSTGTQSASGPWTKYQQQGGQQQSQPTTLPTADIAKSALSEAFMQPGSMSRALMTDPVTQAQALPHMTGTLGAMAPIPGGTTMGTVGGRQLSNAALRAYGKPELIPSTGSQIMEGALSAAGDVMVLPYVKKGIYGRQIAKAEKAAGVPPPQDIPSLPRPTGTQTVSQAIDDAIENIKTVPADQATPTFWKQLKDQTDFFYARGRDEAISKGDRAKLAWLSSSIQDGLNASVPGRAAPSQAMASSMGIPNAILGAYRQLPRRARIGLEYFGGPAGGAAIIAEYLRRKMGN